MITETTKYALRAAKPRAADRPAEGRIVMKIVQNRFLTICISITSCSTHKYVL
jgi:hypothetical protein